MALTDRQKLFVYEYIKDPEMRAGPAYLRAGYTAKSGNSAEVCACRLLRNAQVAELVKKAMDDRAARTFITADKVLTDVELIKADAMQKVADKDGNMAMANHAAALKACELQGRHLQLWNDKLALMNKDGSPLLEHLTVKFVQAKSVAD